MEIYAVSQFVDKYRAIKIAEVFLFQKGHYELKLIEVNKSGSKKNKELMEWHVLFESRTKGSIVNGSKVVSINARTGNVTYGIQEIT